MIEDIDLILARWEFEKCESKVYFDMGNVEEFIGFQLPDDYKYFLKNYNGEEELSGFIGPEFINLWKYDELLESNKDYGIIEYLPHVLGIGSNGAGECIGIEFNNGEYRIILTPFIGMDAFINIGDSFTDFLVRLDSGQEWFS